MKKLFLILACVAMSVLAMGQDNQLVWANGRLLYGTPIESIDSLTYDEMEDVDTLHLLLPHTLVKVVHDTVYIHDTVYVETDCGGDDNTPSASMGVFSVGEGKQVTFSKGNLQYHPANNEWRFAPSQLDYIGEANSNCSATYNGWLDLFGWGTGDNPTNSSTDNNDYQIFVDWGKNQIGNEIPNTWRTMTSDELMLHIISKNPYPCIDVNSILPKEDIDCSEQEEILLPRSTKVKLTSYTETKNSYVLEMEIE
jgi:hypothetical protein